ncbi:MAG: hypothetical protein FWC89_10320 [Defluviitaleaceae bacterium]|nr:hypothetical protein [Defluviitaleaceae bacterium]
MKKKMAATVMVLFIMAGNAVFVFASPEPYIPPPAQISDYGRRVAEDFLMQLPMLFEDCLGDMFNTWPSFSISEGEQRFFSVPRQHGEEMEDGRFHLDWEWCDDTRTHVPTISDIRMFHLGYEGGERFSTPRGYFVERIPILTTYVPEVYLRRIRGDGRRSGFYTRYGERIEDAPWAMWDVYATEFMLWDFDRNGIPVIMVWYWGNYQGSGDGGGVSSLFRYVDGSFRRVSYFSNQISARTDGTGEPRYGWFPWLYYFDSDGNLVGYYGGIVEPTAIYAHITFNGAVADKRLIVGSRFSWENVEGPPFFDPPHLYVTNHVTGEILSAEYAGLHWWSTPEGHHPLIPGTDIPLTRIRPLSDLHVEISASIAERLPPRERLPIILPEVEIIEEPEEKEEEIYEPEETNEAPALEESPVENNDTNNETDSTTPLYEIPETSNEAAYEIPYEEIETIYETTHNNSINLLPIIIPAVLFGVTLSIIILVVCKAKI